jgi:hypothetical protein
MGTSIDNQELKERMKKIRRRCMDRICKEQDDGLILSVAKILGVDDKSIELRKKLKTLNS